MIDYTDFTGIDVSKIPFNNTIKKDNFLLFLKILKEHDNPEFEEESKDGFVDLYKYWLGKGSSRFSEKLLKNISRFNINL